MKLGGIEDGWDLFAASRRATPIPATRKTLILIYPGASLGMKNVAPVRLLAPVGDVLTLQSVERVGDVTWLVGVVWAPRAEFVRDICIRLFSSSMYSSFGNLLTFFILLITYVFPRCYHWALNSRSLYFIAKGLRRPFNVYVYCE